MRRRGSALIITIFLLTAIGGTVFGLSRLLFAESTISSIYESGIVAYYSAESGIEESFLRYRYDRDTEVPFDDLAYNRNEFTRSNLSDGSQPNVALPLDVSKAYYDLKLGSRSVAHGNVNKIISIPFTLTAADDKNYGEHRFAPYRILKDEAKKFKVNLSTSDIQFFFRPIASSSDSGTTLDSRCVLLEMKLTGKQGGNLEEHKLMFYNNSAVCNGINSNIDPSSRINYTLHPTNGYAPINGIKAKFMLKGMGDMLDPEAELSVKPIGADIAFAFRDMNNPTGIGLPIYGPYTHVESTGYFNGTSRKLTADIDRQSGTLYDLFDYVVYKAN
ncbi:MAG: pilus assembly PilX N-terminal domain-containing protein [Patescibacteria group bacterium]|jgi:hypothetical protein